MNNRKEDDDDYNRKDDDDDYWKSGSGEVVRRWSLLYVSFVVNATKKYRGRTGPVFGARRYAQMSAQMARAVMENCGLYNGSNTSRTSQSCTKIHLCHRQL